MTAANDNGFKIAYTVAEACEATGLGQTTIYSLMKEGRLARRKFGRRTLIPRSSLEELFAEEPDAA